MKLALKLWLLRRVLGLAYVLDGVFVFFGIPGARFSVTCAKHIARLRSQQLFANAVRDLPYAEL